MRDERMFNALVIPENLHYFTSFIYVVTRTKTGDLKGLKGGDLVKTLKEAEIARLEYYTDTNERIPADLPDRQIRLVAQMIAKWLSNHREVCTDAKQQTA